MTVDGLSSPPGHSDRCPRSRCVWRGPEAVQLQQAACQRSDGWRGNHRRGTNNFRRSVKSLDQTIRTYYSGKSHEVAAQFGAFLSLSRRIESLTLSLDEEMQRKMSAASAASLKRASRHPRRAVL